MELYNQSITRRAIDTVRRWYEGGLLAALFAAMARQYGASATSRVVARLLGGEMSSTNNSAYQRVLARFNNALASLGKRGHTAWEHSLLGRFLRAISAGNSTVFKALFGKGAHRFIVVIFALYLPVDWFLRTYSPISTVATMWDEAFLAYGLLYVLFTRLNRPSETRANPLDSPVIAFIGICVLMFGVVSPIKSVALDGFRAIVQYMLWFFVLTRVIESDRDAELFAFIFVMVGVLTALHGIYQYVVGVPIPAHWVSQAEAGVRTRSFSIFGSPNIMGSFMVMTAPVALSYSYRSKKLWIRLASVAAAGVIALACLLTMTRGAWLGFAAAAAVFAWLKDKRILALMLLAAGAAVFLMPDVVGRITFLFTDEFAVLTNFGGRQGRAREGYRLLDTVNAWWGYGMGRFGGAVAMQNQTNPDLAYFYLDNYYLKTLVEIGYIGMIFYVTLLFATVWNGLRGIYRTKRESYNPLTAGLLSGMAGVLVHCFTENVFEVPYMNAYFWGCAALLMWFGFLRKRKAEAK